MAHQYLLRAPTTHVQQQSHRRLRRDLWSRCLAGRDAACLGQLAITMSTPTPLRWRIRMPIGYLRLQSLTASGPPDRNQFGVYAKALRRHRPQQVVVLRAVFDERILLAPIVAVRSHLDDTARKRGLRNSGVSHRPHLQLAVNHSGHSHPCRCGDAVITIEAPSAVNRPDNRSR